MKDSQMYFLAMMLSYVAGSIVLIIWFGIIYLLCLTFEKFIEVKD